MIYQHTHHSRRRSLERRITDAEIGQALADQIEERPHSEDAHKRVHIGVTSAGRILKMVMAYDDDPPVLVTVTEVGK